MTLQFLLWFFQYTFTAPWFLETGSWNVDVCDFWDICGNVWWSQRDMLIVAVLKIYMTCLPTCLPHISMMLLSKLKASIFEYSQSSSCMLSICFENGGSTVLSRGKCTRSKCAVNFDTHLRCTMVVYRSQFRSCVSCSINTGFWNCQ